MKPQRASPTNSHHQESLQRLTRTTLTFDLKRIVITATTHVPQTSKRESSATSAIPILPSGFEQTISIKKSLTCSDFPSMKIRTNPTRISNRINEFNREQQTATARR
jgi:hypothetical protein